MNIWIIGAYLDNSPGKRRVQGFARNWAKTQSVFLLLPSTSEKPFSFEKETHKGFSIWRHSAIPTNPTAQSFSFAITLLRSFMHRVEKPQIIIASSPRMLPCITAYYMAKFYKVPFVLEVRRNWVSFAQEHIPIFADLAAKFQPWLAKRADLCITNCKTVARALTIQDVDKQKIAIVYNGISDKCLKKAEEGQDINSQELLREKLKLPKDKKIVLYVGDFDAEDGLETVVETAPIITDISNAVFVFAGQGKQRGRIEYHASTNPNVFFIDTPEDKDIWSLYALADLVLVPGAKEDSGALRAYMFDAMAASKPIITSLQGESKEILERGKCAAFVNPEDTGSLSRAIGALLENPEACEKLGKNARTFVSYYFLHSKLADRYMTKIKTLIGFNND